MFESHVRPGGYVGGFWRHGFYFESGAYGLGGSSTVFPVLKQMGVFDKIGFVRQEHLRFVSPDLDGTPADYRDFKRMVFEAYPAHREELDSYFAVVDRLYDVMVKLAFGQGSVREKIGAALRVLPLFLRYKDRTQPQLAARHLATDSTLYRFLSDTMGYPDMSAFMLGIYFYGPFHEYWTAQDGMQSMADVLAANFRRLGGELKLRAPVERILTQGNKALGVVSQGQRFEADHVIAACDYKQTFLKLLDPGGVSAALSSRLKQASVSEGWVVVYLGLDTSNDTLRRQMESNHVVCHDLREHADIRDSRDASYLDHCRFELYSPSLGNPNLAPEGKSSLMISAMVPYRWQDNWGNGNREAYLRLKDKARETLIRRANTIVRGLPDRIEFQDAATPLTFERFTHNTAGATCAWSWCPERRFYGNWWTTNATTPIENLLIGSAWATQVGGTIFAIRAGQRCARIIG
jgi:phytoene dehydrogenase-like protein